MPKRAGLRSLETRSSSFSARASSIGLEKVPAGTAPQAGRIKFPKLSAERFRETLADQRFESGGRLSTVRSFLPSLALRTPSSLVNVGMLAILCGNVGGRTSRWKGTNAKTREGGKSRASLCSADGDSPPRITKTVKESYASRGTVSLARDAENASKGPK